MNIISMNKPIETYSGKDPIMTMYIGRDKILDYKLIIKHGLSEKYEKINELRDTDLFDITGTNSYIIKDKLKIGIMFVGDRKLSPSWFDKCIHMFKKYYDANNIVISNELYSVLADNNIISLPFDNIYIYM